MGITRDGQTPDGYLGISPTANPRTIIASRAPLASDRKHPLGTQWLNKLTNTAYFLGSVNAGTAVWAAALPAVPSPTGSGTLASGTLTVANTSIAAGDVVLVQRTGAGGGSAYGQFVVTISAGASFTIVSKDISTVTQTITADTSTFTYAIIRGT